MNTICNKDAQIIGFRKDRLGARIVAIGNLLFLEDHFDTTVRFLWASTSEEYDMDIHDPKHPIFDPSFANAYIRQIPAHDRDQISGLTDLEEIRGSISTSLFEDRLQAGESFVCTNGFTPALFANEMGPEHQARYQNSLSRIVWAPAIYAALNGALEKLAAMPENLHALHVRRGDVLDKEPWCHRNWMAKFAPDEFYTAVMDRPDTTTVLFSDTPDVARKLAEKWPNAFALAEFVDMQNLSEMQRDLVELLLMAACDVVVAPSLSAFSSAAISIGGMTSIKLPSNLTPLERDTSYDAVLARVLKGPDSFFNDGDFAQSVGYAFRHSLNVNQYCQLYEVLKSVMAKGHDFAFYQPIALALAISTKNLDDALAITSAATKNANLWANDRETCVGLGCLANHMAGNTLNATTDFLSIYFARSRSDASQDTLAHYFLKNEPQFNALFQIDDIVMTTVGKSSFGLSHLFPNDEDFFDGALNSAIPLWLTGADWGEMFEKKNLNKNLTNSPRLEEKASTLPQEIVLAERNFFRDQAPLPTDEESLKLLSVYAVALRLSGRFRRAVEILYHCRNNMPQHPIFLKRLGDQLLTIGKRDGASSNFNRAAAILPDHPGLTLARAQMAQDEGDHATANRMFMNNSDLPILPLNYFKSWELTMRKLKSPSGVRNVILEASKRFPDHAIFQKRWAGKL